MPVPTGYTLTYAEEFDGASLPSPWQLGYYFSNNVPSGAVTVSGGALHLTWTRGGASDISVSSSQTFHYGYFEVRMKWTVSNGAWPAFWMIPPSGITHTGEIDVFEGQGNDNQAYFATLHEWTGSTEIWKTEPNRFPVSTDFSQWHTYALLWEPGGSFKWYFDDVLIHSADASGHPIFDTQSVFPILSMQEGNNWSVGNVSGVTANTLTNDIDYFRVYQGTSGTSGTGGGGTPTGGVDGGPTGPSTGTGGTGTGSGSGTTGGIGAIQQVATTSTATVIPGGNFGPGTHAMLSISATFPAPVTAGSTLLVTFAGDIVEPGPTITPGPTTNLSYSAGGSLPDTTYYVQLTYIDGSGNETAGGGEMTLLVPSGNVLVVTAPANVNLGSVPGATGWNVYVSTTSGTEVKQNASPLGFGSPWTEPTSGLITGTTAVPTSGVRDSLGNTYTRAVWIDGGLGGSQFGTEALGIFYAADTPGGSNTVTLNLFGFNVNPIFDTTAELNLIAFELSAFPDPTVQSALAIQQANSTSTLSVTLDNSLSAPIVSSWGSQSQSAAAVVDFLSLGVDSFLAITSGNDLDDTITPTITGGTYSLVASITSPGGIPLMVWTSGPTVPLAGTQHVRGNIDWDQTKLVARQGATRGILFQYSDGTFTPGNLPRFMDDGTLTDSGITASAGGGTTGGGSTSGGGTPIVVNGTATVLVNGTGVSFDDTVLVNGA